MRTYLQTLFVLAATTFGLSTAHAQLQTFNTLSAYAGSQSTFAPQGQNNSVKGQTFTNVSSVKSMTYAFFNGNGLTGVTDPNSFIATFGQWNGTGFVAGTTVSWGTINVPAMTDPGWASSLAGGTPGNTHTNYLFNFDLNDPSLAASPLINSTYGYLTNPNLTYALMLENTQATTSQVALGLTNSNAFAYGYGYPNGIVFGEDWTFSQIVITPGNVSLTPVPESSTVAALAGATFLTGLVIKRRRQKSAAAPLAAA